MWPRRRGAWGRLQRVPGGGGIGWGGGRQRAGRSPGALDCLVPSEVRVAEDMHVRPQGMHTTTEGQRAHRLHDVDVVHGVVRGVV